MIAASPWRVFWRNRPAVVAMGVLVFMATVCFGSLPWSVEAMRATSLELAHAPPSAELWFGADALGRSLFMRTLYGGAISLSIGLLAAMLAVVVGTLYGCVAGYVGGRVDDLMMRAVDILYALPYILLVMLLAVSLGAWLEAATSLGTEWSRFVILTVAIAAVSWLTVARVIRGQVLALREQAFIEATRALGLPGWRVIIGHLLPNLGGPIAVFATLTVPQAILQESFLSFLGVGVQPPQATWGSLAADGIRQLNPVRFAWWQVVFPCGALSVTLLALNFVGDGLRDALDVRRR